MRHALLLLPLLLAACHKAPSRAIVDQPETAGRSEAAPALPTIPCTLQGHAQSCTVERIEAPDGLVLLVRHPDGGFRRLLVTEDGRGVAAADGNEPTRVTVAGPGEIDVVLGGERYRLPATVGG
ncbi:hypothetical protein [Sphingomonas sp.]|uniref:hypothetical protein n=1 Tax=Sphingomonas sp. TaxID=28214 RepID=UPI003AFFD320